MAVAPFRSASMGEEEEKARRRLEEEKRREEIEMRILLELYKRMRELTEAVKRLEEKIEEAAERKAGEKKAENGGDEHEKEKPKRARPVDEEDIEEEDEEISAIKMKPTKPKRRGRKLLVKGMPEARITEHHLLEWRKVKIQQRRAGRNGRTHHVALPTYLLEDFGWKKGDALACFKSKVRIGETEGEGAVYIPLELLKRCAEEHPILLLGN